LAAIALYDNAENAVRYAVGLPLRKSTVPRQDIDWDVASAALSWVLSPSPLKLPIASEADLRRIHPNLAIHINRPVEQRGSLKKTKSEETATIVERRHPLSLKKIPN